MNEVILYSTGCPQCNVLKTKLTMLKIPFTLVEGEEAITAIKEHGLMSAPLLTIDGAEYKFANAVAYLRQIEQERKVANGD